MIMFLGDSFTDLTVIKSSKTRSKEEEVTPVILTCEYIGEPATCKFSEYRTTATECGDVSGSQKSIRKDLGGQYTIPLPILRQAFYIYAVYRQNSPHFLLPSSS